MIVRVGVVDFLDAIGDETLAAREERASQSRLVERAHASEVSDDAEALRELDGASEFSEELGEHDVRRLSRVGAERADDGDVIGVRGDHPGDERFEVQRLVVVAVAHARVLQRRHLEDVQELGLVREGLPVSRARARDLLGARGERLASRAKLRKGAAHSFETALDVRHLRANRVVALRSAHEGAVLLQRHLLLPASRALPSASRSSGSRFRRSTE